MGLILVYVIILIGIVYKQPKIKLEKNDDYEQKKNKIDRYKKVSRALLKKDTSGV